MLRTLRDFHQGSPISRAKSREQLTSPFWLWPTANMRQVSLHEKPVRRKCPPASLGKAATYRAGKLTASRFAKLGCG